MDRFIPNRSAMDFDYAHYMLTTRGGMQKPSLNASPPSEASEAYRKLLAETFNMNRTRILAFKDKPSTLVEAIPNYYVPRRRHIPKIPERTMNAPDILDDEYLNLLDWGSCNVLSIALGNTVHLWNAGDGSNSELVTIDEESGPVTSVKWAPDGRHIAVALNNSEVQLWDSTANTLVRAFRGGHAEGSGIGAMDWNNHNILTTGGMDSRIINIDVRARAHVVENYRGHQQEVCGLKWSASGHQLASGGKDNLLHIWDRRRSTRAPTQWLHRLKDHTAAVKALAWCPFQSNLLASGGEDRCIKFWNSSTGACLNSVDTGSQVCALLWNQKERELLSSHGLSRNQLTLWKYPSMVKVAELSGHTSTVLYMAQSPDGCTVASAAGDETLMLWNVFGKPEVWIVGDGVSEEEQMKAAKQRGVCSSHSRSIYISLISVINSSINLFVPTLVSCHQLLFDMPVISLWFISY